MRLFVLFILALGVIQASEVQASEEQTYEVRPRDRFETLAARFGVTPEEIRAANPGAYGIRCLRPFTREGRDGERRAYCGRPRYYLIAGKTLTIPTPRLIVESENVRLEAENTAFLAERDQARAERDSLKEERDALVAERDRIAAESEELLRAKQELQGRYDELAQTRASAPVTSETEETNSNGQNRPVTYNREGFAAVILALLCGVLFICGLALYRYLGIRAKQNRSEPTEVKWKIKEDLERIRQGREDLDATRRILVQEGHDLAERRRQIETDGQKVAEDRLALDKERESLRTQRDELVRWEENLSTREAQPVPAPEKPRIPTTIGVPPIFPPVPAGAEKTKTEAGLLHVMVARGRHLLEEEIETLVGREAACTARERAVERHAAALDALQAGLVGRERDLVEKEHGVEELRKSLSGGKARCDKIDFDQAEREENLVRGFADLDAQRSRLVRENQARQDELNRLQEGIDAKIRMYDEDIAPAIAKAREELAAREAELTERTRHLAEAEESARKRAAALDAEERDYERRLKELNDANGTLDERAEKLGEAEQKLSEDQIDLRNSREAFINEVDAAKSTLARAKRKKEITEALDRRESAVAGKERELADLSQRLDDRAANLGTWEERLKDKARGLGIPDEDDDATRQVLPSPSSSDGSITHLDFTEPGSGPPPGVRPAPESGPAIGVELYTCAVCDKTMDAAEVEGHKAVCPKTARRVETITPPADALLPESFYCNICLAIVASTEDEYRAHQERHESEAASKPEASGGSRIESPSRCVCPQCGKVFPWEEIEEHKCVL